MSAMDRRTPTSGRARGERGEATRERLLRAAIDVFGRRGFEASTRELARAAGVNLAAIPYHFGSKRGLYLAAAEHIASEVRTRIGPALQRVQAETDDVLDEPRARALLQDILEALARVMVDDGAASWARFVIREQMDPSEAFERLHGGAIGPTFAALARLIGRITGRDPCGRAVRIQVPRLVGQILILRAARATVLRELRWERIGEEEFALIRDLIRSSVEGIRGAEANGGGS